MLTFLQLWTSFEKYFFSASRITGTALTLAEHKSLWSVISMYGDFTLWNLEHKAAKVCP